jgi:hypothetical protein
MYKPAKHVNFDADKRDDQEMMVCLNALAMAHGRDVAKVARELLAGAADNAAAYQRADRDLARKRMWPN